MMTEAILVSREQCCAVQGHEACYDRRWPWQGLGWDSTQHEQCSLLGIDCILLCSRLSACWCLHQFVWSFGNFIYVLYL